MPLTIINLSAHPVLFSAHSERTTVPPRGRAEVRTPKRGFALGARDVSVSEKAQADEGAPLLGGSGGHKFGWRRLAGAGARVRMLEGDEACPWRVYSCKVDGRKTLYLLEKRDTRSFLSELPDATSLADVCLPGTHDTMAFYGWPISQCQSTDTPLATQLNDGIRVLDIRLSIVRGRLIAFHGISNQRMPFTAIRTTLYAFLRAPASARETLVVSIKPEDAGGTEFSRLVRKEMAMGPGGMDMWWLKNEVPSLGEVRGKAVLLSRFAEGGAGWPRGGNGIGIHPPRWPDSARDGFEWWCGRTLVRTQDWYAIPSFLYIPEKTEAALAMLRPPPRAPMSVLSLSFFSASSPLAVPPLVARGAGWPAFGMGIEGVNSRAARALLGELAGLGSGDGEKAGEEYEPLRGWTFLDFYGEPRGAGVVPLLIEFNFVRRAVEAEVGRV